MVETSHIAQQVNKVAMLDKCCNTRVCDLRIGAEAQGPVRMTATERIGAEAQGPVRMTATERTGAGRG